MSEIFSTYNPGLVIFDTNNPWSVINICPPLIRKAIEKIPREHLILDEKRLKKIAAPDEVESRFRLLFWDEYNAAVDEKRQMKLENIITSRLGTFYEYFTDIILPNNRKLSWILTPPSDYFLSMRDLLYTGLDRIREIMELPIIEDVVVKVLKDGTKVTRRQVNTRLIGEIVKITQNLNDRVHGAVVQRMSIQQKTMSINQNFNSTLSGESALNPNPKRVPVPVPQERMALPEMTELDFLDTRLKEVNQELAKLVSSSKEIPDGMILPDEIESMESTSDPLGKFSLPQDEEDFDAAKKGS